MSGMKSVAMSGARWTVGSRAWRALLGIGTIAVLARHLTPSDYGIVALILFVTSISQLMTDFGLRVALVQRKIITEIDKNSVFWANTAVSGALLVVVLVWAEEIAAMFQAPGLATPLRQVSPVLLINAFQGVSMAILERRFDFRSVALGEICGSMCGAATAVAMVLQGFTIEAVVAQQLVFALVGMIMVVTRAGWMPGFGVSWSALRPLLGYGGYVALGSGAQFLSNQIDRPILARALSATALGYFSVANQIVLAPILIVVQAVARVFFPMMSAIQDDLPRTRAAFLDAHHAVMLVMVPICLGIVAVAEPLVAILLGPAWTAVGPILVILALRGILAAISRINGTVLSAQGQARLQFRWSVMSATVSTTSLLIAAPYGLFAAIGTQLIVMSLLTPVYAGFALRQIGQSWGGLIGTLARPLAAGATMCLTVRGLLHVVDQPDIVELPLGIVTGVACYAVVMLTIDRDRSLNLLRMGLARGTGT